MAKSTDFINMFSGDISNVPEPMHKVGWVTGYSLSIYGNEYTQQCPFKTVNEYGDGRAISVLEALIKGNRWEMQFKGSGCAPSFIRVGQVEIFGRRVRNNEHPLTREH